MSPSEPAEPFLELFFGSINNVIEWKNDKIENVTRLTNFIQI